MYALHKFIYCGRMIYVYMPTIQALSMSSVRLSHSLKARLVKIGAKLSLKDGKSRSMEEIIDMLIDSYEKHEK